MNANASVSSAQAAAERPLQRSSSQDCSPRQRDASCSRGKTSSAHRAVCAKSSAAVSRWCFRTHMARSTHAAASVQRSARPSATSAPPMRRPPTTASPPSSMKWNSRPPTPRGTRTRSAAASVNAPPSHARWQYHLTSSSVTKRPRHSIPVCRRKSSHSSAACKKNTA